jgi:hypothetical protein
VAHDIASLPETRDWQRNRAMWVRVLEKQTGEGLDAWNRRIGSLRARDERGLRAWLAAHGVTGYAQSLLVMERFGYPDFVLASAGQLIEQQYSDRPRLLPIYDAVVTAAARCGDVVIQARKSYVSLVTPRRTFARVQPSTKARVDLGLRLSNRRAGRASALIEDSRDHASAAQPDVAGRGGFGGGEVAAACVRREFLIA